MISVYFGSLSSQLLNKNSFSSRNQDHLLERLSKLEGQLHRLGSPTPLPAISPSTRSSNDSVNAIDTVSQNFNFQFPSVPYEVEQYKWVSGPNALGRVRRNSDSTFRSGLLSLESSLSTRTLMSLLGSFSVISAANIEKLEKLLGEGILEAIIDEVATLKKKGDDSINSYTSQPLPPASEIQRPINGISKYLHH